MNLIEMRARVREDLQDTDSATYHWTDDEVDGAIQRVVLEYSIAVPIQKQDDLATTLDDTNIDISTLTEVIRIESVEFPIGERPPSMQPFNYWAGSLYMTDLGDGEDARVRWLQKHTLAAGSTTIPLHHDEVIVLGATGYLAMSQAAYTVDRASIAGRHGSISYRAWGKERLVRYDDALNAIRHSNRVVQRRLYTDD